MVSASIIVTDYDGSDFVRDCLKDIARCRFNGFEILMIDLPVQIAPWIIERCLRGKSIKFICKTVSPNLDWVSTRVGYKLRLQS